VLLFEAEVLRHLYVQTADPARARLAMELLRHADELFPDTYSIKSGRFDIALETGRLDDADAVLDRLALLDPDSSVTHLQRAKLHLRRGELTPARFELAAAAQRDSFSWRVPYYQARVSKALHDRVATRTAIQELLRRSPDNFSGLALLAREDLDAGNLACAEQIYARLVARKPLYFECVQLGNTRNRLGRYREAADSFHLALVARPNGTAALLNLAESLLLAGDTGAAEAQLRILHEILARKRRDAPAGALEGADLLIEAQTLAYLGRDDLALATEARARVAELLTAARPEVLYTDALYTAALVHEVLGDRDLAATYVTKHLESGGDPAEFEYRWFDDLRRDPVLGPRLGVPHVARSCDAPAP
jgi:tetratricopeptide (TPR) repeat protein